MTCDPDVIDPLTTVTLTWDDDSLVLGPDCPEDGEGLWWSVLNLPQWAYRYTQAPPSAWVPGNVLLAAVPDSAALVLAVAALGTDQDSLETQKGILTTALSQWPYTVQVDVGPVTLGVWRADPTIPQWGPLAQQDAGLYVTEAAVAIPVNPVGAP